MYDFLRFIEAVQNFCLLLDQKPWDTTEDTLLHVKLLPQGQPPVTAC